MRISQAADLVGVPSHVLRHWEDEGVLLPERVGNQREFTEQHVNEARIIHRLRQAGVGLAAIKDLRSAGHGRRAALLTAAAEHLAAEASRAEAAAAFLRHTAECVHPVVDDCPQCRDYATAGERPLSALRTGAAQVRTAAP